LTFSRIINLNQRTGQNYLFTIRKK